MKALTIKQPYANQILYTGKDIEMRSWKTNERGLIAIHASAQISDHFRTDTMNRYFYLPEGYANTIFSGAIIGVVELLDCVEKHHFAHFRPDEDALYGFVLANPRPLPQPITYKGQLKFWDIPIELEKEIKRQLRDLSGS